MRIRINSDAFKRLSYKSDKSNYGASETAKYRVSLRRFARVACAKGTVSLTNAGRGFRYFIGAGLSIELKYNLGEK
jgi:hypothetical protein